MLFSIKKQKNSSVIQLNYSLCGLFQKKGVKKAQITIFVVIVSFQKNFPASEAFQRICNNVMKKSISIQDLPNPNVK